MTARKKRWRRPAGVPSEFRCRDSSGGDSRARYWAWGALLVVLLVTTAVRVNLLDVPLERDEGEYAYGGQLILQGMAPYEHLYSMKMPGIYAAYALLLLIFGQTHQGIHLGLLVINAATVVLTYLLARRFFSPLGAMSAAAAFAVASLSGSVQGVFANAEHFVILPALGGILLLLHAVAANRLLALLGGALLLGLAFVMKQHGAAFVAFGGAYLLIRELWRPPRTKTLVGRVAVFLAGVLLPFGLACLLLWRAGAIAPFKFWAFDYAREYVTSVPLERGVALLRIRAADILASAPLLWTTAGVGLTAMGWSRVARRGLLPIGGLLLFSFLAVVPGLFFRPHYFVLMLPAAGMLVGAAIDALSQIGARKLKVAVVGTATVLLVLAVLAHSVWNQRAFLFSRNPADASRMIYPDHPFPESLEVARVIGQSTREGDRIAVIGSEPQVYFYARRLAATGYVYTYEMVKNHPFALEMQHQMIQEIETWSPDYLLFVRVSSSWSMREDSPQYIFDWMEQYRSQWYDICGIIDMVQGEESVHCWGVEECRRYAPRSDNFLVLLRRRT